MSGRFIAASVVALVACIGNGSCSRPSGGIPAKALHAPRVIEKDPVDAPGLRFGAIEATARLPAHKGSVPLLAFSHDGKQLISGGAIDKTIHLWDVTTSKVVRDIPAPQIGRVRRVAFSLDDTRVLLADSERIVRVLDAKTGAKRSQFVSDHMPEVVAWSPDGKSFAVADDKSDVSIVDIATGKIRRKARQEASVTALTYTPDGKHLLIAQSQYGIAQLTVEGKSPAKWLVHHSKHQRNYQDLAVSPNGMYFCACCTCGLLYGDLVTTDDGSLKAGEPMEGYTNMESSFHPHVTFSPDSKAMIVFGGRGGVEAWLIPKHHRVLYSRSEESAVISTSISPDGRMAATGYPRGDVQLWRIAPPPTLYRVALDTWADEIRKLQTGGKYEELDRIERELVKTRPVAEDGKSKLLYFYYAGLMKSDQGADSKDKIESLQKWAEARPKSAIPLILLGNLHIDRGWAARGTGFADTVTEAGGQIFLNELQEASKQLLSAQYLAPDDPEVYALLVGAGRGLGWRKATVYDFVRHSQEVDPGYYRTYEAMAEYLLPRWFGGEGELEKWAGDLADSIGGDLGDEMYFRIVCRVSMYEGKQTFHHTKLDAKRAVRGGEGLMKRHPANYQTTDTTTIWYLARLCDFSNDSVDSMNYQLAAGGFWAYPALTTQDSYTELLDQLIK